MLPRTQDHNRKGCKAVLFRWTEYILLLLFFFFFEQCFPGLLLQRTTMCWTESEEQLFQMSWGGSGLFWPIFFHLTFKQSWFAVWLCIPKQWCTRKGSAAVADAGAATEEMVYKVRATSPSNRINHLLLTSANYVAAELKKRTRMRASLWTAANPDMIREERWPAGDAFRRSET